MKKIIFTYFIIIFSIENIECQSLSKYEIVLYYNWKFIGNVISADINKNFKKSSIILGASFYLNQIPNDKTGFVFKKRAYGLYTSERLGLNFGYKYLFRLNSEFMSFVFSNFQYSNPRFRLEDGIDYNDYGKLDISELSPSHHVIEILIGLGLNIKIYKNLNFYQCAGIGKTFLFYRQNQPRDEIATTYRIGMSYFLCKNNSKKNINLNN